MDENELDKRLREFEKKHPVKKVCKRKPHMLSTKEFVEFIEKQLDNLPD